MPCYHPLTAYRLKDGKDAKTGKWPITFNVRQAHGDGLFSLTLPCGRCIGCTQNKAREWAIRCIHEASLYDEKCFVTLTYSDEFLPPGGNLVRRDFQLFMKRLRRNEVRLAESEGRDWRKIRAFYCGEYGDRRGRPHFHAILFNFEPHDVVQVTLGDQLVGVSSFVDRSWGKGISDVKPFDDAVANYVSHYTTKKYGKDGVKITRPDGRTPEFGTGPRRNGLGYDWYQLYKRDLYPSDNVVIHGTLMGKPPRYYDRLFEREYPSEFALLKKRRLDKIEEYTPERLLELEKLAWLKYEEKTRRLDNES